MGAVNTTYTFTATDTITSTKMNNIIDQTTMTGDAILGTTLEVTTSGQLKVRAQGITSNELAASSVKTIAIEDGAVTSAKLNSSVTLVPSGAVMAFAMNSAPDGWLVANGDTIPNGSGTVQGKTANFSALYSLISSTYGSAGKLPDLRGYFVRGHGLNSDGTNSNSVFGGKQADGVGPLSLSGVTGADYFSSTNTGATGGGASKINMFNHGGATGAKPVYVSAVNTINETVPRNISLLYCIKY